MHKVFVYGTLMKGHKNHMALFGSKCILKKAVLENFAMYSLGAYPGIIPENGAKVRGELYLVSNMKMKILDMIEGEGFLYKLTPITLYDGDRIIHAETYVYLHEVEEENFIPFEKQPWNINWKKEI